MHRWITIPAILAGLVTGCGGANSGNAPAAANVAPAVNQAEETAKRVKWAAEALDRAEKAYNALDFAGAAKEAEDSALWDPSNPKPWELLARCEEKQGKQQPARDAYLRAAKLSAGATQTALLERAAKCSQNLADRAFKHGEFKLAQEHAFDALRANAGNAEARRIMADAMLRREQHADARVEYQRIADESTGLTRQENLYWVGICGLYLFEYATAEAVFNGLITEGYQAGDIYLWRGRCRFERKDVEGAKQDFRLAIDFASTPEQRKVAEEALAELNKPGKPE